MKNQYSAELPMRWSSKGKTISKSTHHTDMFIIEHGDGTFHNVSASHEKMVEKYPVEIKLKSRG
jgi:hypothetical protein